MTFVQLLYTEGPFLISCKVDKEPVYWMVNKNYQVMGTKSVKSASLFYIKPADDPSHPSDFFIMYYGHNAHDKKKLTHLSDPYVKLRAKETPLPRYLICDTGFLGFTDKPLALEMSFKASQAQFSLYSRAQSSFACLMCRTTNVDMSSWLEGEQFYISCNRHALKLDSFIAMVSSQLQEAETQHSGADTQPTKTKSADSLQAGEDSPAEYQTVSVLTIKHPSNTKFGMLFRLHPQEFKDQCNPNTGATNEPLTLKNQQAHLSELYSGLIKTLKGVSRQESNADLHTLRPSSDPRPSSPFQTDSTSYPRRVHYEPIQETESLRGYFGI